MQEQTKQYFSETSQAIEVAYQEHPPRPAFFTVMKLDLTRFHGQFELLH